MPAGGVLPLALLLAGRLFHHETVDSLAVSRHTHVEVCGTVALVRPEADGDLHVRIIDDHGHFVVGEIVPYHPLAAPVVGQGICVWGVRRYDNAIGHGWYEVHPIERWEAAK